MPCPGPRGPLHILEWCLAPSLLSPPRFYCGTTHRTRHYPEAHISAAPSTSTLWCCRPQAASSSPTDPLPVTRSPPAPAPAPPPASCLCGPESRGARASVARTAFALPCVVCFTRHNVFEVHRCRSKCRSSFLSEAESQFTLHWALGLLPPLGCCERCRKHLLASLLVLPNTQQWDCRATWRFYV